MSGGILSLGNIVFSCKAVIAQTGNYSRVAKPHLQDIENSTVQVYWWPGTFQVSLYDFWSVCVAVYRVPVVMGIVEKILIMSIT